MDNTTANAELKFDCLIGDPVVRTWVFNHVDKSSKRSATAPRRRRQLMSQKRQITQFGSDSSGDDHDEEQERHIHDNKQSHLNSIALSSSLPASLGGKIQSLGPSRFLVDRWAQSLHSFIPLSSVLFLYFLFICSFVGSSFLYSFCFLYCFFFSFEFFQLFSAVHETVYGLRYTARTSFLSTTWRARTSFRAGQNVSSWVRGWPLLLWHFCNALQSRRTPILGCQLAGTVHFLVLVVCALIDETRHDDQF